MDDQKIIGLFFQRDERAVEAASNKYGSYCRRIALNILSVPEDVEECLNDTWHALWKQIPPTWPQSLRAFCGRIVRNLSISRFRASRAGKRFETMELLLSELDDCIPSHDTPEEALDRRLLAEYISQWLRSLSAEDRRLFIRRYWYGEAVHSLAQEQDCPPNTLSQRLMRLRRQLRAALEAKGVAL